MRIHVTGATACPVLVGALGPQMLELAGRLADGTVTFQVGPRTLAGLTCPTIARAAERAGRGRHGSWRSCPWRDERHRSGARRATQLSAGMARLPSYTAMIDRAGRPGVDRGRRRRSDGNPPRAESAGVTDVVPVRIARKGSDDHLRTGPSSQRSSADPRRSAWQ